MGDEYITVTWLDGGDEEFKEQEDLTDINKFQGWLEEQGYDYNVIS